MVYFAVSADKFRYTSMGGDITIEGVVDKKDMEETRRTFSLLGKAKLVESILLLINLVSLVFCSLTCRFKRELSVRRF